MKRYFAEGNGDISGPAQVFVDDGSAVHALKPRFDLWNHSPDGFNWGYGGSGPAQLALAILADCLGDDADAVRLHQVFKADVVSG